jgi:16S rRNA (guanine966-N2)-methyltransferase
MRIIAGRHRGRRILPPRDQKTTRPIVDRVKEALFSRLMSLGMFESPGDASADGAGGWRCVDIFCGTGSLGLEALSRGAERCMFVDRDRDATERLRQNLADLGETDRADILQSGALNPTWTGRLGERAIRIAFLDPPYAMMKDEGDRAALGSLLQALWPRLEDGGVVVLRTHEDDPPLDPAGPEPDTVYDGPASFRYGTMALHFYQRPLAEHPTD